VPVYQCASPMGMIPESMKADVATAITDAHLEATGAPREFVHVFSSNCLRVPWTAQGSLTPKCQR